MTTVLLVVDEPLLVRALRITLDAHGLRVVSTADLGGVRDLADEDPPDAALLDIGLPGDSGSEAVRSLRSAVDCPVVVLTGPPGVRDEARILDAGAVGCLVKPFAVAELLAVLGAAATPQD
ncbi:DNA-binding response regulator [Actinoalloteichus sp. AHMU CJ021]|uniref:Response regulator receiver domain-containing protein n=1 Tax=Actinoalloteichus caeruleus DSM 43889 TaxID=1120930 RepID=A0ABT1JHM7_ACTCY|nr:response regulator [Actinoalloteichus caeruleus]AUS78032.1 DNA-binding response regulator [Actinoalloteichus sp. AHMU CJ021]MCP2332017.1 Response regulator receiver domain-containing protein [Actinoalloteichus caeruleus DSM 43889]